MLPEETNAPLYADLIAAYQCPVVGWDFSSLRALLGKVPILGNETGMQKFPGK